MRILYAASDQVVPGRTGGSVHVLEVARGLASRGHELHAVLRRTPGSAPREEREGVTFHRVQWTPPHRLFRFRALPSVLRILDEVRPAALMERYYNFGGEGIRAAERRGVPSLLEVNSPVLDHPGSWKARLDSLALVHPLRTYRESLCRKATALVSPLLEIVPPFARVKTERVSWGANVEAFDPRFRDLALRERWGVPRDAVVVLFSGSFRPWHGVPVLEAAARLLRERRDLFFLLVGGARAGEGQGYNGRLLGSVPYESMPGIVASCDIGVAPYDTARLGQLRLGFYWSPLKIFEYMASGLPTLTISDPALTEIVREGVEGLHIPGANPHDLARAIERLAGLPGLRAEMGRSARERVVARYSWAHHCAQLEGVLMRISR